MSPPRPDAWGGTPSGRDILQQQVVQPWGASRASDQVPTERPKSAWDKDTRAVDILRTMAKFEPVEDDEPVEEAKAAPDASADDLLASLLGDAEEDTKKKSGGRRDEEKEKDKDKDEDKDELIR